MLSSYGAGVLPQTVHEGHKGVVPKPFAQKTITSAVAAFMNITRYIFFIQNRFIQSSCKFLKLSIRY